MRWLRTNRGLRRALAEVILDRNEQIDARVQVERLANRLADALGHRLVPSRPGRTTAGRWTCACGALLARVPDRDQAMREHLTEVSLADVTDSIADVWDAAAEATAAWCAAYQHGSSGPPDPPPNPYRRDR